MRWYSKILMGLCIALAVSILLLPANSFAKKKFILVGSTQTASSHYAYGVAAVKSINKYAKGVSATVVETGASVDNVKRLMAGQIDIGLTTYKVAYEALNGLGIWKKHPAKDLRMLWAYTRSIDFYVVRADSGVYKLEDLDGKLFNPGMRGSSTEFTTRQVFEILGIKPKYYIGGTTDAVKAIKDGRIVGYIKTGVGTQLDASTLDVMSMTKIRLISMTPEQVRKVRSVVPYLPFFTIPAGGIKAMPDQPEYTSWGMVITYAAMKSFPEDLAYKIVKAVVKGRPYQVAAFPAAREVDMVQFTPKTTPIPLHAGALKAYRELGAKEIPARAIPPEAK